MVPRVDVVCIAVLCEYKLGITFDLNMPSSDVEAFREALATCKSVAILTGAGLSAASGKTQTRNKRIPLLTCQVSQRTGVTRAFGTHT